MADQEIETGEGTEPASYIDIARGIRNKEQWARYDSVVIGPGARDEDPGWFNNWTEFAAVQDEIKLFAGARKNANPAYSNSGDREDWAQLVYGMWAEFLCPVSDSRQLTNPLDLDLARWWTTEVPRGLYLTVKLQDTDQILSIPATYAPSGHGGTELRVDGASAPTVSPGNNGSAQVGQCWQWPIPIGVPAVKRIQVGLKFDRRIFSRIAFASNAPGFTTWVAPDPGNPFGFIITNIPNRFVMRVGLFGPRFVQLRGAYSQGQT